MKRKVNPIKTTRRAMEKVKTYTGRAKILRQYFSDEFNAGDGFDLRSPDSWTPSQKALVTRRFNNIDATIDAQEKHEYETDVLKTRVKQIRPYFGKTFKPSDGYDLRDIENWTARKRKKATRYFMALAPELTTEKKVVKRMRDPERLERMILRSDQTELLPGQTAAVFHVEKGRDLTIQMDRGGNIQYELDGVAENELRFNIAALHKDPQKEIARVLALTDANVFKMKHVVGESYDTFSRAQIAGEVLRYMNDYAKRTPKRNIEKWNKFMTGLIAFPGETKRAVQKESRVQRALVDERRKERAAKRGQARRKYTIVEAKLGRKLTKAERARGRRGRVK